MKYIFLFIVFLSFSIIAPAQESEYLGMHGLKDDNNILFLEYRGYNISVVTKKGDLGKDKIINDIAKKEQLGTILANYSETISNKTFRIVESSSIDEKRPNITIYNACYITQKATNTIQYILFQTLNQRDFVLEKKIIADFYKGYLDKYTDLDNDADEIDFVGRKIKLGNLCKWRSPNNVNCNGGQISWSEFSSYQEAIVDLQGKVLANEGIDIKIIKDEDIELFFEGIPTIARRIVYTAPNERYPLAVYYIAQEVRERYVSCILSNYVYNRNDYELAPLLQQIIKGQDLPAEAISEFDRPILEEPHTIKNYWSRYNIYGASIRAGMVLPLGNASSLYDFGPSISLTLGIPVKSDMALDFFFSWTFLSGRKPFDYYLNKEDIMEAKANALYNIGGRFRYQKVLARNIYFTPYIGAGYHSLSTNKIKRYAVDENDYDEYYNINTFFLLAGTDIRFKRIGAFIEYNYTPYGVSKHARKELGNSSFSAGLYFVLW